MLRAVTAIPAVHPSRRKRGVCGRSCADDRAAQIDPDLPFDLTPPGANNGHLPVSYSITMFGGTVRSPLRRARFDRFAWLNYTRRVAVNQPGRRKSGEPPPILNR